MFSATDANKDGAVTRDEFTGALDSWFTTWDAAKAGSLTAAQITDGLNKVIAAQPSAAPPAGPAPEACGGRSANPRVACPADVDKMIAALPDKAPARPLKPRKILVLGTARGFVHSSIPLAARMMEEMGKKTGAWTATTTYDAADINTANLKQYDAIFLDSNTGCFLDDPNDQAATDARRAALLEFVRGGKGLAGIHATTDSYHGASCGGGALRRRTRRWRHRRRPRRRTGRQPRERDGRAGGQGRRSEAVARGALDARLVVVRSPRSRKDRTRRAGRLRPALRVAHAAPRRPTRPGPTRRPTPRPTVPGGQPLWPEWNTIIGGYFKFHWVDPQLITVKIDDPKSPLTAMFHGQEFEIHDETYTFNQESFSRTNVHVLTSIDYDKMSAEDKAKENPPRTDHDYALSYIRREGQGRVFYEAHGHAERNYAVTPLLEHVLAGVQYALGDLKADDSPSVKK